MTRGMGDLDLLLKTEEGTWIFVWSTHEADGLALTAEARLTPEDHEAFLSFVRAAGAGRRALFAQTRGPLRLYADPRPEGCRLTLEWNGAAHATCGVTLSHDELKRRLFGGMPR